MRKTSIEINDWFKDRKPVSLKGIIIDREALKYCDEAFSKSYRYLIRVKDTWKTEMKVS